MARPTLAVADGHQESSHDNKSLAGPLCSLIAAIISQHHEYLKRELPAIEAAITEAAQANTSSSETAVAMLPIFVRFRREMESHMKREEITLFPLIERLEQAASANEPPPCNSFGPLSNAIQFMNEDHEFENKLMDRLGNIAGGFVFSAGDGVRYAELMARLRALKLDLDAHILKEDGTLFPEAIRLEENRNS